jgi:hypothetical protein
VPTYDRRWSRYIRAATEATARRVELRDGDRWLRWVDPAHSRMYGAAECEALLKDAGLVEVRVERYKISWLWGLMTARAARS